MGVTRVAVMVRAGDQPICQALLLQLAEPILHQHRGGTVNTHFGDALKPALNADVWFNSWTPSPDHHQAKQPTYSREYQPCPVCGGSGQCPNHHDAVCAECRGQAWRIDWEIDQMAFRTDRFLQMVESGAVALPHIILTPEGRILTDIHLAVEQYPDAWWVSAYSD